MADRNPRDRFGRYRRGDWRRLRVAFRGGIFGLVFGSMVAVSLVELTRRPNFYIFAVLGALAGLAYAWEEE